jgi:hypothetical protein
LGCYMEWNLVTMPPNMLIDYHFIFQPHTVSAAAG